MANTIAVPLGKGVTAHMHPQTGRDHLIAATLLRRLWSAQREMGVFMKEEDPALDANITYENAWAFDCAQTEQLEGLDYLIPAPTDEPVVIFDAYTKWLELEGDVFQAWYNAPETLKKKTAANPPALQPGAENATDPLPESSSKPSAKK